MIKITTPGWGQLSLKHLVLDYNGTMAVDGKLLPGVKSLLVKLSGDLNIHVLTADTFGLAGKYLANLPVKLTVMPEKGQDRGKRDFIRKLGAKNCVCIGNGLNDSLMLKEASLGICLIQKEGASTFSLSCADVICLSVNDALELLLKPKRLIATLRK
jgi:soluble P-type ATPase